MSLYRGVAGPSIVCVSCYWAWKVETATKLLQLENYFDRKPCRLTGGQRQRVAKGRAIVREPAVFLFDEPLSNLAYIIHEGFAVRFRLPSLVV